MLEKNNITNNSENEQELDATLRPLTLDDYIGQTDIKEMMRVFITSAKQRHEALDHVLLYGPPGLGKTTLAGIIAREMEGKFNTVAAPSINRVGDLVAILSNLEAGDILFIDEIHRLPKVVEEVLYSAMEDYVVDIVIGKDATASSIRLELPPFTLVGATTRAGDISAPLRDRFGITHELKYYTDEELQTIVKRTSRIFNFAIDDDAALEIAKRSRGTPRIANKLFRRVRDFAMFDNPKTQGITLSDAKRALDRLGIDQEGLNETDHKYLRTLIERFKGGPVGLKSLAASISEEVVTLEDVYEPYLLQKGFIVRSPRGRVVTDKARVHLGYPTLDINTKPNTLF